MQLRILSLSVMFGLILSLFLSCSEESSTEPESPTFNASGTWALIFTQTKIVGGDYIECGTEPVPQRSYEITQNGTNVSLKDKNGKFVNGTVTGSNYKFDFKELEDTNDVDYIDFNLEFKQTSDTTFTGTYRINRKKFFIAYNDSFYCITEGTLTGTKPSEPVIIFETGTVTDIDGNIYQTIKIGTQWWMAENLKVTHYRNGDVIPNVIDNSEWSNLNSGGYCSYNNLAVNSDVYGLLYNWYAVNDSRGLAPQGWHIPSNEEWGTLITYLGGFSVAGGKMKEEGTSHWEDPNIGATNESGFKGIPGGYRWDNGTFMSIGSLARFFSSSQYDNTHAIGRYLYSGDTRISVLQLHKKYGFSIRCVQN